MEEGGQTLPTSEVVGWHHLDAAAVLHVLKQVEDAQELVSLRAVCRRLRVLANLALEQQFCQRWGVVEVVSRPPCATFFAAACPNQFVRCHRLSGARDTLAGIAIQHGCDPTTLKRLNGILSDGTLGSRDRLFVPLASPAGAPPGCSGNGSSGGRVAFVRDEHSRRRFVVWLSEGEDLEAPAPPARSSEHLADKLAMVMQRALCIDAATARYYIANSNNNLRQAMAAFEGDRQWERAMKRRPQPPKTSSMLCGLSLRRQM